MKIFQFLLVLIFAFLLNVGLFYTSENYRNFLESLKEKEVVKQVNDDYKIPEKELKNSLEEDLNKPFNNKQEVKKDNSLTEIQIPKKEKKQIKLTKFNKEFLEKIYNKYGKSIFSKLEVHSSLMDVTSEYPDDYFEFYSPELTIYFFPTKTYKEVKEIFQIESNSNNFSINEVNNFWESSFYINIDKEFRDNFVRFIYLKNNNVIWIKVSRNEYNSIKNIINN